MHLKLKVFEAVEDKALRLAQNLTMAKSEFNQFMRLRNELVIAAEYFAREKNLSPVLIGTMSKDLHEQLKLAHKVVDIVDRANRKIFVTLLRYRVGKTESSYAQVQLLARKKKDEKLKKIVSVNYKLEENVFLLDVTKTVYDNFITYQPNCKFP